MQRLPTTHHDLFNSFLPFRFHFFPLSSASRRLVTQSSSHLAPRHSASVTRQLAAERDSASAVTSIHVFAFYSYSILRRICTACRSPTEYYLDVLSLCKYSFSNCPRWLPCFFQIKDDCIDRCKTFTSQDFGSFSIISSIYVCAFHRYSILRRIFTVRCSPSVHNLDVLSLLKLPTLVTLFFGNPNYDSMDICKKVYITRLQQLSQISSIHVCIFYSYNIFEENLYKLS